MRYVRFERIFGKSFNLKSRPSSQYRFANVPKILIFLWIPDHLKNSKRSSSDKEISEWSRKYLRFFLIIGLSKLNRIVQYYAKRPQVQERLTNQIGEELKNILDTDDVAVIIDAKHLCVSSRGSKDESSATVTSFYSGVFNNPSKIIELNNYIN